ncbi:DUF221-domain-containing protein [Meredithblackwellia eburnea MCA 4105]
MQFLLDDPENPTPGLPPAQLGKYRGPWLSTQLTLSLAVGLSSFLFFCFARKVEKWRALYSPRTLLKGFSPHEVHEKQHTFFGWILPTLRTSEFTVLQIVGLDAAVLLSFFRTCFLFFLTCTALAFSILVPINYRENGTSEGVPKEDQNDTLLLLFPSSPFSTLVSNGTSSNNLLPTILKPPKVMHGSTLYLTSHLVFTYIFTILALFLIRKTYARFIPLRQLFSLELAHSVPARTVMLTELPPHLRSERALAEYFEKLVVSSEEGASGLGVESVTVVRAVGGMKELLERRTKALVVLEKAWAKWVGNPVPAEGKKAVFGYDPVVEVERIVEGPEGDVEDATGEQQRRTGTTEGTLVDLDEENVPNPLHSEGAREDEDDLEARLLAPSRPNIINPNKKRPTIRKPFWFYGKKVDALEYYAEEFRKADEVVKVRRRGKFRPTGVAFVTFESLAGAQIAAQTVHYPSATSFHSELAPEPRDIQWFNLSLSPSSIFVRQLLVVLTVIALLSVWSIPVAYLAKLLSWDTIQDAAPKLAKWIAKSPRLAAFVQTSLPSLAMVMFNNFLPFFLEALSVFQGLQARSWIEYSLLKKYHISILFTTLFVFITSSTYTLLTDISESPAKVLDKLATTLPYARNFFVSYVMLSGIAIMPLQLLELAVVIPRFFYKMFVTTPRDHAELNAPPMLNLGTVYPQALLIFTLGVTYSIITPLILPFTTLYFGLAYLVYKYKLLFVYYRPYESRGQAWPLAFNRIGWGLLIFQVFMLGLFIVRKAFLLAGLIVPLLIGTTYFSYRTSRTYGPLARFVNLSQACEVAHSDVGKLQLRRGQPVTRSQANLQRARYAHNDEGIYVVGQNPSTDYSQPPMSESFPGVLNQGRRRYGHPALSGSLPEPWLPASAVPSDTGEVPEVVKDALVMNLRRRWSVVKRAARNGANAVPGINIPDSRPRASSSTRSLDMEDPSRAWAGGSSGQPSPVRQIGGDENIFSDDDEELEEGQPGMTRYRTYWVHPHKSGRLPGAFPPSSGETDDES